MDGDYNSAGVWVQWHDQWASRIAGDLEPMPAPVFTTAGGRPLLMEDSVTLLCGPASSGKTTIALAACAAVVEAGGVAVYLTWERHRSSTMARRLSEAGLDWLRGHDCFRLVDCRPDAWYTAPASRIDRAREWASCHPHKDWDFYPCLVVFDSVTMAGGGTSTDDVWAQWFTAMVAPWLHGQEAGGKASILLIDHTGKDPSRGARGTQAKTDQVDIQLAVKGTGWSKHAAGEVELVVVKDGDSMLDAPVGKAAALIKGKPLEDRRLRLEVCDPDPGKRNVESEVLDALEESGPMDRAAIAKAIRARRSSVLEAVRELLAGGDVAEGENGVISLAD